MSSVLSCLLSSLIGYRMLREAAAMPAIPWTKSKGVPLEAWIHIDGRNVPQSIREGMKPEWHVACKEEVYLLLTGIVNFESVRYWALTILRLSSCCLDEVDAGNEACKKLHLEHLASASQLQ